MVGDYKSRKNEVLDSYDRLESLVSDLQAYAKKIEMPDPMERLGNLLSDIRGKADRVKADRFNIVIAGESKSGKSTFINAYLGEELLPMDVKQCTSAIVEIKYGESFSVNATYADGRPAKVITDRAKAREFLKKNAALDDEYRDIPVPTINSEILVKSGLHAMKKGRTITISKADVEDMLQSPEVQAANVHNIPNYNDRIRKYIETKKDSWQDIITKIEVIFRFGEDLRGIEIIDTPGVCARGGVSEITDKYIEKADAIIFLKPVIGQALESEQFNQFLEQRSVDMNKDALFLVLTHIATKNEADIRRLEGDAHEKFSSKINEKKILFVDSKAKLYSKKFADKKFADIKNVGDELRRLNSEGILDGFVTKAYFETNSSSDIKDFINKLEEQSQFDQIYDSLNTFGRNAHYRLLASLLDSINNMYGKLWNDMNSRIDMFKQKAEDPTELAKKIAKVKQDLDVIQNQLSRGVNEVVRRFRGDEGIIKKEAEAAVKDFLSSVGQIDPKSSGAFTKLESVSLGKIDQFKKLTEQLQHQVVDEFDKELIELSDKDSIPFESLKPDFTDETFKQIKDSTESKAQETKSFEEGWTFKETHTYSVYKQDKHFEIIKNDILGRLDVLKNDLTIYLEDFVEKIRTRYIDELAKNADAKKSEFEDIREAKISAEQNQQIIKDLTEQSGRINDARLTVEKIKGGIDKTIKEIDKRRY